MGMIGVSYRKQSSPRIPWCKLRLEAVPHALAACAHGNIGGRERVLRLAVLTDLGKCIDKTADKADKNGRAASEGDRGIEKYQTAESDWELVQGANH